MKKAYVKLKPKSVKKTFKKAYIAAAAVSAALCAFLFSSVIFPESEVKEEVKIEVEKTIPDEIAQVSENIEIEIPSPEEVLKVEQPEIKPPETKEEKPEAEEKENYKMPVQGEIINDYSGSVPVKSKTMGDWRVHSGIDIKAEIGTAVVAPAGGKVIKASYDRLTGNTVSIEHIDGVVSTVYNLESISVTEGQKIKSGEKIGTAGQSAALEMADEPHVHFEMKKDGKTANPKNYIK